MDQEISELIEQIKTNGHDVEYLGAASTEAIKKLEDAIGKKLPPSLESFLKIYGSMAIYDSFMSGIFDDDPLQKSGGSIYAETMWMREEFDDMPNELWVVEKHEDGAYCVNLDIVSEDGESPIVNFEYGDRDCKTIVAKNFREFFVEWYLRGYAEDEA